MLRKGFGMMEPIKKEQEQRFMTAKGVHHRMSWAQTLLVPTTVTKYSLFCGEVSEIRDQAFHNGERVEFHLKSQ